VKVTQSEPVPQFNPIVITLETKEEAEQLRHIMRHSAGIRHDNYMGSVKDACECVSKDLYEALSELGIHDIGERWYC
jgi:hypothetical protein